MDFTEATRIVIDQRHAVLIALDLHDRNPRLATEFLQQHRAFHPHTLKECPIWPVGEEGIG